MTAISSVDLVHLALHERLSTTPEVEGIVSDRIYDEIAPASAPFPRMVISSPTEDAFNAVGRLGNRVTGILHLWTRTPNVSGKSEVLRLYDAVKGALHTQRLTLNNGFVVDVAVALISVAPDPEDVATMHGVVRYIAEGRT